MKVKVEAPDRLAWLEARLKGIGASDAAAAVGLSPYKSPFQLWSEKTGRAAPTGETEAMRWGHKLQRVIGEEFEEETGRPVQPAGEFVIYEHPESGILLATLDFFQYKGAGATTGVLEAKTAGYAKKDDWQDTAPLHYIVQVQHQLLVTGLPYGSIAALIGGQRFVWKDIAPDVEFQTRLRYALEKFWRDYVIADVPPPTVAEDNLGMADVFKEQPGLDLIAAPGDAINWDEERLLAIAEIKAAEQKRDLAEARLKSLIGERSGLVLPNGVTYLWRTEQRNEYTVPAGSRRVLRRKQ